MSQTINQAAEAMTDEDVRQLRAAIPDDPIALPPDSLACEPCGVAVAGGDSGASGVGPNRPRPTLGGELGARRARTGNGFKKHWICQDEPSGQMAAGRSALQVAPGADLPELRIVTSELRMKQQVGRGGGQAIAHSNDEALSTPRGLASECCIHHDHHRGAVKVTGRDEQKAGQVPGGGCRSIHAARVPPHGPCLVAWLPCHAWLR